MYSADASPVDTVLWRCLPCCTSAVVRFRLAGFDSALSPIGRNLPFHVKLLRTGFDGFL